MCGGIGELAEPPLTISQMVVELRALPLYRTMPSKEAAVALRDARWDIMVRCDAGRAVQQHRTLDMNGPDGTLSPLLS